jgi:hypothetical protein
MDNQRLRCASLVSFILSNATRTVNLLSLSALDTTHMVIIVYAMWYYLIDCFLQPAKLLVIEWPMFTELGLTVRISIASDFR